MSAQESKVLEARQVQYHADYSEDFKASIVQAVANNNGNVLATSKLFNLPRDTVYYWWRHSDRYLEVQQPSQGSLADQCEGIARNLAESMGAHDLSIVPLHHKASAFGVVVDRMQLLRGQPTSITENVDRQELTLILENSLNAIDVAPE
jgi:hypothetical protein